MIYLTELKGKEVIDKMASIVGVVEDVAIDEEKMLVRHLVVQIDKSKRETFNLGKGLFGGSTKKIDILAEEVGAIADKVLLNRTLAQIFETTDDGDDDGES